MAKRPSFQFYPGDWLRDMALRSCSVESRGLWMDMLCFMTEGNPFGYLKVGNKVILPVNLSVMVGLTLEVVERLLQELKDAGVFSIDETGCIFSRRMVRDEQIRLKRAAGGKLGGNPELKKTSKKDKYKVNHKDNLHNNLAYEDEDEDKDEIIERDKEGLREKKGKVLNISFDDFWDGYDKKVGDKTKLEKKWADLKDEERAKAMWHIPRYKAAEPNKKYRKDPATYLNNKSFNDEIIENHGTATNNLFSSGGAATAGDRLGTSAARIQTARTWGDSYLNNQHRPENS